MFEVKPHDVEKKSGSIETDDTSSSSKQGGGGAGAMGRAGSSSQGSQGSGSLYLYDSQDWVTSPVCSPEEEACLNAISPMLAEETFRYMTYLALDPSSYSHPGSQVLSADRVEQMTKTYNDIDVVTHLLAERDRDLELAARIGQSLLQRNHLLQERNESVEEQLTQALDQVHQLQHELGKKDELLRMVASASEESETDSSCSTPLHPRQPLGGAVALSQLEALQGKLSALEEENLSLRSEACHLKKETITYEEKEQQLVNDCVKELRESNSQMVNLTEDLSRKSEEVLRYQEEIAQLLSQIVELQHRVKELALEKEELRMHLQASKDAQRSLTAELNELADRNAECVGMLHETQEEIRELRSKSTPSAGLRRHLPYGLFPMDSLAAEIEGTMRRERSVEDEVAFQDQRVSQKRVFQTVRVVNESVERAAAMATPPIPGSGQSCLVMTAQPFQSAQGPDQSHHGTPEDVRLGKPGAPGQNDLVSALHRLSLRRQNFLCERQFFLAERDKKLQSLAGGVESDVEGSGHSSPMGSVMSSFTNLSEFSVSSSCFKTFLPEKLQIVKPMEGSLTLHHWQQLAKPHLGTILDPHPGVVTKGFRPLPQDALSDAVYRLTDLEEDEEGANEEEKYEVKRWKEGMDSWEKRSEQIAEEEDEDEEEGGITFKVRSSSTPEDRREIKRGRSTMSPVSPDFLPLPGSPLLPPTPVTSALPLTSYVPCDIIGSTALFAPHTPVTSTAPVQSQSQAVTSLATSATTSFSVHNPGKCQSSTFSTYTFTTCRILHPSDITQVTSSSHCQPSISEYTPSSLRTGPCTPVTPCRLSLGVDSFPPRRPPAPCGLAKLVLERGISASLSTSDGPPPPSHPKAPLLPHVFPSTPPNSPSHSPSPSPVPFELRPCGSAASDNFLASRPAELFLQDVYGLKIGRAPRPDLSSPDPAFLSHAPRLKSKAKPDPVNVNLVERLRRLGLVKIPPVSDVSSDGQRRQDSATFLATGGSSLLDGLRRNQSLPTLIGAARGSPSHPGPPQPPTSLAIAPPPWGNMKQSRSVRTRPASTSNVPPSLLKRL
ncbi:trafficking kinesin-binding protein 2 isoform X1 [Esox lucius]|uniref:Trafficking protein, kinesin binding 2 n=2 Tax=Esox lucius TaxID=8010 RepID=A0AAY5JXQ9_ESOLU|nr:trafficking kinesin-binding protein 2 isoform X1 [Esox lucius]